jgi:hypothetical protein
MLPTREIVLSLPPTQTRARFEPAPMIAGERHVGFGLRLRGWLTRWWRTPLRPEETVSGAALADAGVGAEPMPLAAETVGQPVVETVDEYPGIVPVARGRSAIRLDPARDDGDWCWPASAGHT